MSQKEKLLEMFKQNGNKLTLGQIMGTNLGCEFRSRFTEMRQAGVNIIFTRGKTASENLYTLIPNEVSVRISNIPEEKHYQEFDSQLNFGFVDCAR